MLRERERIESTRGMNGYWALNESNTSADPKRGTRVANALKPVPNECDAW